MLFEHADQVANARARKIQARIFEVNKGNLWNDAVDELDKLRSADRALNLIRDNGGFYSYYGDLWAVRVPSWLDHKPSQLAGQLLVDRDALEWELLCITLETDCDKGLSDDAVLLDLIRQDLSPAPVSWRQDLAALNEGLTDRIYEHFEPENDPPVDGPEILPCNIIRDLVCCIEKGGSRKEHGDYVVFSDEHFDGFWQGFLRRLDR